MMRPERMLPRFVALLIILAASSPCTGYAPADDAPASPALEQVEQAAAHSPRALRPLSDSRRQHAGATNPADALTSGDALQSGMPDLKTVAASLSLVLGLFLTAAWLLKRSLPKSAGMLPSDVVQVLGRTQLAGKQFAHLVRCGNKLLLVNITPGGAETLTEITEPLEVDRLLGICAQQNPTSATAAFRDVFQQLGKERSRA
ncbi:MAG: flagellar biosynthetic protein FliO [Planctomycetia bacterium]|nr:flagellar biosynthetic protein FliO [Planctomycetia bacterium]